MGFHHVVVLEWPHPWGNLVLVNISGGYRSQIGATITMLGQLVEAYPSLKGGPHGKFRTHLETSVEYTEILEE